MDDRERKIREIADLVARAMLAAAEYAVASATVVEPASAPVPKGPPKELLSIDEAAEFLGLSRSNLRTAGEGPPSFTLRGRVRYDRAALEVWVAAGRRSTARGGAAGRG